MSTQEDLMRMLNDYCLQRRAALNNNIPPNRIELQPSPYDLYTKEELDMRRKIEILKNRTNTSIQYKLSKAAEYTSIIKRNVRPVSTIDVCDTSTKPTSSSASGIPGPPITLQLDPTVPVYNLYNNIFTQAYGILPAPVLDILYKMYIEGNSSTPTNVEFRLIDMFMTPIMAQGENTYNFVTSLSLNVNGSISRNISRLSRYLNYRTVTDTSFTIFTVKRVIVNVYYNDNLYKSSLDGGTDNPYAVYNTTPFILDLTSVTQDFFATQFIGNIKVYNIKLLTFAKRLYNIRLKLDLDISGNIPTNINLNTEYIYNIDETKYNDSSNCQVISNPSTEVIEPFNTSTIIMNTLTFENLRVDGADIRFISYSDIDGYIISTIPPSFASYIVNKDVNFQSLTQMSSNTHYKISVVAFNLDKKELSTPIYVDILTYSAPTKVSNVVISDLSINSLRVTFSPSELYVTGYHVSLNPSDDPRFPITLPVFDTFFNINNLNEGQNYTANIVATGIYGNSIPYFLNFITKSRPSTVTDISYTNLTATSVTISHSASINDVVSYVITFTPSITGSPFIYSAIATRIHTYIGLLQKMTQYTVSVQARGIYGESSLNSISFNTFSPPTDISNLVLTNLTNRTASISWSFSEYYVTSYRILLTPQGQPPRIYNVSSTTNTYQFTELEETKSYNVVMYAIGTYGQSGSKSLAFTTYGTPTNITGFNYSSVTDKSVVINYNLSQNSVLYYSIRFIPDIPSENNVFDVGNTVTSVLYTGLTRITNYTVSIQAIGVFGNSNISILTFTTFSPAYNINNLLASNITGNTVTISYDSSRFANYYLITFTPSITGSPFNFTSTEHTYSGLSYLTNYSVTVKAIGTYGNSDTNTITFTTFSPASIVTGLSYENITGTTATIKYNASNYYVTGYKYILYYGNNEVHESTGFDIIVGPTDLSYTFTNLQYTRNYFVEVFTLGQYGNSNSSGISFTTKSPASAITGLKNTNIGANIATIEFYPSVNNVLSYNISFNPSITNSPFSFAADANSPLNVLLSFDFSGLNILTSYSVNVFAVGLYGNSALSQTTFTTFSPASPITGFTITDLSTNVATIRFSQSIYNVINYRIQITPGALNITIPQPGLPSTQIVYSLSNLIPLTNYSGNIYAIGTYGNSSVTNFNFTTKSVPSDITGLVALNVNAYSADISFNNSIYDVINYVVSITPAPLVGPSTFTILNPFYKFDNTLNKLTNYTISVYAVGLYGVSNTNTIQFSTFSPAEKVTNLYYTDLSINTVTIHYTASLYTYAYRIFIEQANFTLDTPLTTYTINNLNPGTNYTVNITSLGTYGNSDTAQLRFTTFTKAYPVSFLSANNIKADKTTIVFIPSTSLGVYNYLLTFTPSIEGSPFTTNASENIYSGLSSNTEYTVSVVSLSIYQNSDPISVTFRTFRPAADVILTIDSVRAYDVSFSYTASQYNLTGYYIDISGVNTNEKITQTVSPLINSLNVSGLNALTSYVVSVKALGTYGNSNISSSTITTFSPALPISVSYDKLTTTSVNIFYTSSTYQYGYNINVSNPTPLNITTTDLSYNIIGLNPGTNYTILVKALGIYGNSNTETLSLTTFNVPSSIQGLNVTNIMSKSARLIYNASNFANTYNITITDNVSLTRNYSTTALFYDFTDLSYTKTYNVSIYAVGTYGNSATTTTSFTTFIDPTNITGLNYYNLTASSVDISFNPSSNFVTGYFISFNPPINGISEFIKTTTINSFTGLINDTFYNVSVFAIGTYGNSNISNIQFTTYSPASNITGLQVNLLDATSINVRYNVSSNAISYEIKLNGTVMTTLGDISASFYSLLPETFYLVEVKAIGIYGNSATASTTIQTYSFPTSVSPIVISYIGATNVLFSYKSSTNYLIGYNLKLKSGSTTLYDVNVDKSVISYEFTSLNVVTNYTIEVYAKGTYGNSTISTASFTTYDVASNITGLTYQNLTSTSVNINYNASSNYVTGYQIIFNPSIDGSPFTTTSLTNSYTGLTKLTSYTVSVKALGIYGNSQISTINFISPSPAESVTGLTITNITLSTAKILYNASLYSNGYLINISPSVTGYTYPVTVTDISYTFIGLELNTIYTAFVTALGIYGNSPTTSTLFTTKNKASNIQNLRVFNITAGEATISCTQSFNDVSGYYFSITPGSIPNVTISSSSLQQDSPVVYNYTGLTSNTLYTVSVYAIGIYGNSQTTDISFLTFRPASNITNLRTTNISSTNVTLQYDESLYNVLYYEFTFSPSIPSSPLSLYGTLQIISELTSATNYTVSAKAVGLYGNSGISTISFTTTVDSPTIVSFDISSSVLSELSFNVISGLSYDVSAIPADTNLSSIRYTNITSKKTFTNFNKGMLYYVNLYAIKNGVYSIPTVYNLYNYTDAPSIDTSNVSITTASFTFGYASLENQYTGTLSGVDISYYDGVNTSFFNNLSQTVDKNIINLSQLTEDTSYNMTSNLIFANTKSDYKRFTITTYPALAGYFTTSSSTSITFNFFTPTIRTTNIYDISMISGIGTSYRVQNFNMVSNNYSYTFNSLTPGMIYNANVYSISQKFGLKTLSPSSIYTLASAPSVVINPYGTYVILNYTVYTTDYTGNLSNITSNYNLVPTSDISSVSIFTTTLQLNNLSIGSLYNITSIAYFSNTYSDPYVTTFSTLPAPTELSIISLTSTTAKIIFTPVSIAGSYTYDLSSIPYTITGSITNKYYQSVTSGSTITGLTPGMLYSGNLYTVYPTNGGTSFPVSYNFYTKTIAPNLTFTTTDNMVTLYFTNYGNIYTGSFVSLSYEIIPRSGGSLKTGTIQQTGTSIQPFPESTIFDGSYTSIFVNTISDLFRGTFTTYPSVISSATVQNITNTSVTFSITGTNLNTHTIDASFTYSGGVLSDISINTTYTKLSLVQATKYTPRFFKKSLLTGLTSNAFTGSDFTTKISAPSPTVNSNGYYLNVTFSTPFNSLNDSGAFSSIIFTYKQVSGGVTNSQTKTTNDGSYNITGLTSGTQYDVSMDVNYVNTTSITYSGRFTTLSAPSIATNVNVSYTNPDITTSWTNGSPVTSNYVIIYDNSTALVKFTSTKLSGTSTTYTVDKTTAGLSAGIYYVKIMSFNQDISSISAASSTFNLLSYTITGTGTYTTTTATYGSVPYTVFTFTSGTNTFTTNKNFTNVRALAVGGGGPGASVIGNEGGGGGGAGEVKDISFSIMNSGAYNITIGQGGKAGIPLKASDGYGTITYPTNIGKLSTGTVDISNVTHSFYTNNLVDSSGMWAIWNYGGLFYILNVISRVNGTTVDGSYSVIYGGNYGTYSSNIKSVFYAGRKGYDTIISYGSNEIRSIGGGSGVYGTDWFRGNTDASFLSYLIDGGSGGGGTNIFGYGSTVGNVSTGLVTITGLTYQSYKFTGGEGSGNYGGGGGGATTRGNNATASAIGNGGSGFIWINNNTYGIGGNGGDTSSTGVSGNANTGNGGSGGAGSGGGSSSNRTTAGNGGSGIVIIAIPTSQI